MSKPSVLFFCGPHSSGKSTILRLLHENGVISICGSEIGKDLYYERNFDTQSQDEMFEFEVTEKELMRDGKYSKENCVIGIESWHPGNLAYALVRNPNIVAQLVEKMKTSPLLATSYGFYLKVSEETIYERTETFNDKRKWAAEFYSAIDKQLDCCFEKLGLKDRVICVDANKPLYVVYDFIKREIQKINEKD